MTTTQRQKAKAALDRLPWTVEVVGLPVAAHTDDPAVQYEVRCQKGTLICTVADGAVAELIAASPRMFAACQAIGANHDAIRDGQIQDDALAALVMQNCVADCREAAAAAQGGAS